MKTTNRKHIHSSMISSAIINNISKHELKIKYWDFRSQYIKGGELIEQLFKITLSLIYYKNIPVFVEGIFQTKYISNDNIYQIEFCDAEQCFLVLCICCHSFSPNDFFR